MTARRRMRQAAIVGLTLIGLSAGLYYGWQIAIHHQPAFYSEAVAVPLGQRRQAGQEFERNVLALHNDLQEQGRLWERIFTDDQINGWLTVDLPEKFPDALPPGINDPRVALTPGQICIAFQYQSERLSTVVSLLLEIALADEPNTVAVRIRRAQAGWIPLPLDDFLSHISRAAQNVDVVLRWAQNEGDPVAIVTLPEGGSEVAEEYLIKAIRVGLGEVLIQGQTGTTTP